MKVCIITGCQKGGQLYDKKVLSVYAFQRSYFVTFKKSNNNANEQDVSSLSGDMY